MLNNLYTHYGWFYFVPINYRDTFDGGCMMAMRWTDWFWPVDAMGWLHNFVCVLTGIESDFPIYLTGRY